MKIGAIYLPAGRLPYIFGQDHQELTINLGTKNLYKVADFKILGVTPNPYYLDDIFDDKINLLSCIVGANGGGKTTLLKHITSGFCNAIIEESELKYHLATDINSFHRIYYTPHLSPKILDAVGENGKDLSKLALIKNDNHGNSALLDDFMEAHSSENSKRWIKFNNFLTRNELTKVKLPSFTEVELSLGDFEISTFSQKAFHDTSYQLREVFITLLDKIETERNSRELQISRDKQIDGSWEKNWHFPLRFEYEVYEAALGKLASILERAGNHYLSEGYVPKNYEATIETLNVRDAIEWFIDNAGVYKGDLSNVYRFSRNKSLLELIDYTNKIISQARFESNWRKMIITEEEALNIISLYDSFNESFVNDWFNFDPTPMFRFQPLIDISSGEQQFLNLFSTLYYHSENIKAKVDTDLHSFESLAQIESDILLLLDEGDNSFHPQWKKEYIKILRTVIPIIFEGYHVQIIITSHDPLILSDIPKNNAIFLEKVNTATSVLSSDSKKTFGANISDLLKDSFFLQDDQIGSFAAGLIDKTIKIIRNKNLDQKSISFCQRIINSIDEPIVKFKLAEMLSDATQDTLFEADLIEAEIERLQNRKNQI